MLEIDKTQINADLYDILLELKQQLNYNGVQLFHKIEPGNELNKDVQVCCPYHKEGQERRPSAGFRKKDGLFHCFTCGEVHSLPEVISHCFGKNDNGLFGWSWLLKNYVTAEREERKDVEITFERDSVSRKSNILDNSNSNQPTYVSEEELDNYRYIHPYMYKRKLTDDVIERFDIGYDKNTRCITFPVRDINGKTLFIARRSVVSKFFNYPQGVEKPLYGLYELHKEKALYVCTNKLRYKTDEAFISRFCSITDYGFEEIVVCESMIDALTCWVYGKYAVALNGLGNYLQFEQLRNLPCRELILATDNDEAGAKARERIRKHVRNKIISQYDYDSFPYGAKDINDLTKEQFEALRKIF